MCSLSVVLSQIWPKVVCVLFPSAKSCSDSLCFSSRAFANKSPMSQYTDGQLKLPLKKLDLSQETFRYWKFMQNWAAFCAGLPRRRLWFRLSAGGSSALPVPLRHPAVPGGWAALPGGLLFYKVDLESRSTLTELKNVSRSSPYCYWERSMVILRIAQAQVSTPLYLGAFICSHGS